MMLPYSTTITDHMTVTAATMMNISNMSTTMIVALHNYDTADNAWMMTATALVLLMTPAVAFFYGGLVDHKNVLNQLFLSFICMGIIMVQWVLFGFSLAFAPPAKNGFGFFQWAILRFGKSHINYSQTYPLITYAAYQGTFAIITPALISGAIVGRMKLIPYMIFIFIWSTVCYDPMAHWVWNDSGWLKQLGTLDFAGGTVVHILSGVSALVAAIILGKRHDYDHESTVHRNLPFTLLGTCLLWVGWTGFNGGSAYSANGVAALAVMNTHIAAAAGLVTWIVLDGIRGRISVSGACCGPIVGLVGITPACGYVHPQWALLIGAIASGIVYGLLLLKHHIHYDDTLDVSIVHGCGGVLGAFMTGLFCEKEVNPTDSVDGAFFGRPIQMWYQTAGILTAIGFGAACTAAILLPLHYTIGIRLDEEDELKGLDVAAHGESWESFGGRRDTDTMIQKVLARMDNAKNPNKYGSIELQDASLDPLNKPHRSTASNLSGTSEQNKPEGDNQAQGQIRIDNPSNPPQ